MNIRQLRAGNLVTTNGKPMNTVENGIYKVVRTALEHDLVVIDTTRENFYDEATTNVSNLFPIRIKTEMPNYIGFKLRYGVYCMDLKGYEFRLIHDSIIINDTPNFRLVINEGNIEQPLRAEIKYLHTLQNIILDITGLDLNVDNLISK
jgi:hypothetical protein